jgi:tRNA1(Val) A37 N6-methylase TrmN6
MPLTDANGQPIGKSLQQAQAAQPQTMGFAVFKKIPGGLMPLITPKGDFAILMSAQHATQIAQQMAQAELMPNKDQKVVTPLMKSSEYFVVALQAIGMVQAKVKNPDQLLAPAQGKVPS